MDVDDIGFDTIDIELMEWEEDGKDAHEKDILKEVITSVPVPVPVPCSENHAIGTGRPLEASQELTQLSPTSQKSPKRNFPGPAGLLPKVDEKDLLSKKLWVPPTNEDNRVTEERTDVSKPENHQTVTTIIDKAPWKTLLKTLNLNAKGSKSLLKSRNISWVYSNGKHLNEATMKIPFLTVIVEEKLASDSENYYVKLMDVSGSIAAALNPDVVKFYKGKIKPGTALALRNVSIFKSKSDLFLSISMKSILFLAATSATEEKLESASSKSQTFPKYFYEKGVLLVKNAEFDLKVIEEEYEYLNTYFFLKQNAEI